MARLLFCLRPVLSALLGAALLLADAARAGEAIPRPYALQPAVRFWTRVYSEVDTASGFVHDATYLDVVYDVVRFPDALGSREQQRRVDAHKARYRAILRELAAGKREGLDADERRVLRLWPSGVSAATLRAAAENIRFQLGQADRFREGVVRSGQWQHHIERTLVEHNVPVELAALPHVESSYNPFAISSVGASGMWQFMPSTGRRFMRVDDVVDERLDPWKSSEAAAKYLSENYRVTGAWPLAITGYNHGAGGMRKAAQQLGTRDIATIVRRYKGASFGFASRNFYASFLAALDVSRNPDRFFGGIDRLPPVEPRTVVLERSYSVNTLQRTLGVDLEVLKQHNLALRSPFWSGRRYAPVGYALRLPGRTEPDAVAALAATPADAAPARVATKKALAKSTPAAKSSSARAAVKTASTTASATSYRVRRGDTAGEIARRFGVSERALLSTNGISNPKALRAGQLLRLPGRSARSEEARAESTSGEV